MKDHLENAVVRGFRAALAAVLALALALPVGGLTTLSAFADEPAQNAAEATPGDADGNAAGDADIKIAVLSDTHYYPLTYVSDCEDYETYVGGDPKMLEESGSILDAALDMVRQDQPDVLLVSGDLTKDGEKLGHEQLAERFQKIEDETDTEVFVINGNHDIYNYQDSCTFANGKKESAETTTPDEFKEIYRNFGYDGNWDAQYFTNPNAASGEQAGGLSYSVDLGKFTIVAIDSGMYSPDAHTGYDTNEHVTAGRVDEDLLPWVVGQTKEAEAEGDTVIGLMHHGLVPHFTGEENILSEYVVENWRDVATQFADAGMRYIFTGHMHANDMAQFTSNAGNTITDLETGSLSSWMSPVRTIALSKGEALDDGTQRTKETFDVSSESVKSISFTDHTGAVTQIDDLKSYTQEKLYPKTLFNNMANGMLRPILQKMGEEGIRPWLAENLPDVDIDAMALGAVRDALAGGMEIELGTGIGRVHVEYRNGGIQLSPSGTAGIIGDATITDAQILRLVDDVLDRVEANYIDYPDYLLGEVNKIVTQVSEMGIDSLTPAQHTIYDLVFVALTGHYAGHENPPAWVEGALDYIQTGTIIQDLINLLIDDALPIVDSVLSNTSIDTGIAFSGIWKTVIDSATDDGNLKSTLDLFGFDDAKIRSMVEGLVNEYLSPSFLTGMGSLIDDIASSMLYDSNFTDDEIDGEGATITFDGTATAPEPSVDNGLLPTQVTMTLGSSSQTERNFRWYTGSNVTSGTVQVATDPAFEHIVAEATASSEQVTKPQTHLNLGLVSTYGTQQAEKHSATVSGLDDGATYYYRVGDKDNGWWSAGFQFSTGAADDADDAFTFINVNDSQGMVESDYDVYKNTLAQADATFPTASFTVHGGDFVDDGANEDYWTWALDDANGVAQSMSMTPATGNHEEKSDVEGITDANPIVSHFNLANVPSGQDLSTGMYYSYVYKNATFVVLNTNDLDADNALSQTQYDWAYNVLANAGTQWKIVLMHKSPYSNGPHQDDADVLAIRSQMNALAAACDVDLVLSGHDHVYNRTPFLMRGAEQQVTTETQTYKGSNYETALNPNGTAFVIAGTCGVKNYVQTPSASVPSAVALDLSVPAYSGITIDGDHLYYQAYKVEGGSSSLIDSFAISKAEQDMPAWKQVEDMIAALPEQSAVTVDDEPAITAARAAYDELTTEDKGQVSNYDRLAAAEHMLSVLKGTASKRTVTVSNADDFDAAVKDPTVGTILTSGSFKFDEGGLFDDGNREIYVDRDLVVGGSGELKFCRFHVRKGATLVLKDSVYINDTRTQGSFYDALNPVEVEANSTLITTGSVSLRTEYGTGGSDQGMAVKLVGNGASAILGGSGSYWGAEAAVYSTVADSTVVIDGGSYNLKNNNHSAIDSPGSVTVNGGSISSLWCGGTLRVNGGTFEHEDSASNTRKPVQFDGSNAYVTGGTFVPYQGVAWQLSSGSTVHVMASGQGAVQIGDVDPFVGAIQTQNYKNVSAPYASVNGWGSQDGIYSVAGAASASSVEDVSALSATRLSDSSQTDNSTMNATVPSGTSTVFGKYYVSGNGKSQLSGISGGTVIAYGPVRTIQNNPVESVIIDGDATRLVDLNQEGSDTLRLNGYTTPADAFDNGVSWRSDNEQTATVAPNAGQGIVTVHQAGGANIIARSDSNSDAFAKVEVIAVKPALEGPDELSEDDSSATYVADKGFKSEHYDGRLSFKYSVDDNTIASIDEDTGELAKLAAGSVKVTATLYLDGNRTGITVDKDVVCKLKPTASVDDVNSLIDVQVSDANKAMAAQHGAQTFDKLIDNTEGENDSYYTIGEVYSEDAPAEGLIESAAQFFGLAKAEKIWKVDVTIQAAPYVAAFDEALGLEAGTHSVSGDVSKTVTLVWSDGDLSAEVPVPAGWTLEDPAATPVTFQGVCESPLQDVSVNPDAGNTAYVYDGTGKPFAFTTLPSDDIEGFTVEYRSADSSDDAAWLIDVPMNAGSYDVRVTRAADGDYNAFKQIFESGVVIAKAKATAPDIRYSEGETPGTIEVILQNGNSDTYYWSESDDRSDQQEAENKRFEVTEPGTYYVWGAGDDNHEDSDVVTATIVKVSFDDNDGIVGADESEGAVFTKGTAEVLLPKDQCLDSWGGLPEVEWTGHEFLGWQLPGGKELTKLTAIVESATATAQWGVDAAGLTAYVVFDADGGTFSDGSSSATVKVPLTSAADYVPIADMPADPTRTGYNFAGWFYTDPLTQQEEAFDPERTEVAGSMNVYAKWAEKQTIAITPDAGNAAYVYDGEGHGFAFSKSPDDSLKGFEVEYRPAGSADDVAWTPAVPVNAGTYDVRVARAEDKAYKAFEQTFKGGVVIAKADQAAPALEVTPGVDEATIKIEGAEGAHVAAAYEWSAAEDFSNAQTIEGDSFEATASGTYYVRAVADANHNAGAPANVTLAMVTFDAAGGTLSGNATWLLETGTSVGDANLPTATWNEHGFEGWALADGTAFDGSSVVNGDLKVAAQWSVGAETLAPAAPTGAYVAERLQGVSVALHGVNEINSANDGGAHPDVTFAASGDNVQPLIADSFQIGQPAETDGVWTVSVVLDAQKYLEAYAQMGDSAYGAHYFADPDEDGQESFTLAYDKTSRTWKLAEGQQAGYTFDITCLTLRPAELVKYTGGIDGGEVHFPDARVVDGQGNVYTIDQLNALLDEGTTARVAYFDGDGAELADDTVPGVYEARIVVDAATALLARIADQDAEDSVDVNVYRFSLEPSTLTIRNASDDAAAESGALDVELIAADAGSSDITAAVNAASGGVAAQLPKGTRIFVNDREGGELTGEELAGVRLFSDELLGADDSDGVDRLADLKARAAQEGYEIADEASDFQYLDLVDAGQSNLWVSSTEGATIYWKVPEGADPDSLRVLHFADLHREYGVNAADLQQQIAACAVEEMPLDTTHVADGYVSFPVERAGFSPFVLTWDAAEPDNPDQPVQMATVTFDANGGQLLAGAPTSVEVTAGGTVAALPEPVRAGYTFAGWRDASGGLFTLETVVSGSMTVVAQWTANVYPVTLDPQGGAFGDPSQATIQATFGAAVGELPQPSRDGYEFVGWFTQQQGGEQVTASTVYAAAASSTYYAQWKTLPAAQAAVTLDANGGAFADGTATAQVMLADGAVLHRSDLPQPNRAGYLLAGWCLDAALTQPVLFADDELAPGKQPTVATEGLVLYAKWLGDLSGEASFSFANVQQAYTGAPVPAVPTFGSGFPAAEQARVKVLYHPAQAGADAWSDQAPRNVGSYDVRFVYGGSDAYAPFEKDYPAGIVIAKATLTQTGLVASPAEVKEGMKLADISLTGATVTSSETGAAVEGAWSWVDADGAVDESGMYQAVFVPTDTANYDLLYVEVPLTVQADEPDQPGSGDEPIDPDRPGSDDKPSNPDQPGSGDEPSNPDDPDNPNGPGSGDEPTDPDEPGTSPDQPGSGELGTGGDSDSGVGAGSDNSNGRNQVKLVATGDPIAGVLVGLGAVLIAALVTCLAALRNSGRKN